MKKILILFFAIFLGLTAHAQEDLGLPESPEINMTAHGDDWKAYTVDDLYILMNLRVMRNHGKYWLMNLYILNDGDKARLLRLTDASLAGAGKKYSFYTYDKLMRRIRRRQNLARFGISFATYATAVVIDRAIDSELASHDDGSFGSYLGREMASLGVFALASIGDAAISEEFYKKMDQAAKENIGYLRDYSIPAGTALEGHACVKYHPRVKDEIVVYLPVDGKVYAFRWNAADLEKIRHGNETD